MDLNKRFYDLSQPTAFSSNNPLSKASGKTQSQVTKFLEKQNVYSKHKQFCARFPRLLTTGEYIFSHVQVDLVDVSKLSKYNRNFKFVLTMIDVFSRYGFTIGIRRKTGEEVANAFRETFDRIGLYPTYLVCDFGREFRNQHVRSYLESKSINLIHSSSELKCAMLERWNRTWETRLYKYFTHKNTLKWIDVAEKITTAINKSFNRSIRCTPEQVFTGKRMPDPSSLRGGDREIKMRKKPKYKIGDRVRLWKTDKTFRRGYEVAWTEEIFSIVEVIKSSPPTYRIVDEDGDEITGRVYEREIVRAA